jgi:peptidoglycan/xylan/chitin deacetylase (PgdA/CDA1 family)
MAERPPRARREDRRRAIRRRRRVLGFSAAAFGAAVAAIVVISSGGGAGSSARNASAQRRASQSGGAHRGGGSAGVAAVKDGPPGSEPVPILMYHVIAAPPAGAPYPGLYVPPEEFAEQMQALKRAGWHAVTLDEVAAYWQRGAPLGPGRPIVLSFDNGYQSQYTQALPVLRRMGWVGVENMQLSGLPPSQGGLGEAQVRGLIAAGWELDTQGYSHADLVTLDAEQLRFQVADARRTLQQRYHVPVEWFCYPSGDYDATVVEAVKSAGFVGSTTVVPGWAHRGEDAYRVHRLRVLGGTSGTQLLELIDATREDPSAPDAYTA